MSRKARIGITRDLFDQDGKLIIPGPGLKLLDEMSAAEYEIFPELLPEITPEQIQGLDMVISLKPKWTKQSLAGNNQLLSVHHWGGL
ncbi:hypothetical protein ES703_104637 [subsurface metagenome]